MVGMIAMDVAEELEGAVEVGGVVVEFIDDAADVTEVRQRLEIGIGAIDVEEAGRVKCLDKAED